MSDSAVVAAIAAGRVPDYISEAYLNESRDQPAIAAIIFVSVLTFLVVVCRACSRAFLVKRFGFDDGLAVLSLVLLIPFVALCIVLIDIGSGRHYEYIQYVMTLDTVEDSEVLDFVAHLIYTTALLFCRISGLAFYYRVCSLHDGFLLAIKVVGVVIAAGYLPQMFLIIFHCLPVTGLWPYDWQPRSDNFTCLQWGVVYSVNSSVSLFCDVLLFGIPITMLRVLNLTRKRKIQLACILLPGTLVVGISIARLILVIMGQWDPDMSWSYNPMLAVEVSEIGATLIALSIPGIKPAFDRWVLRKDWQDSTTGGSRTQGSGSRSRGTALLSLNRGPTHRMIFSRDTSIQTRGEYERESGGKDNNSMASTDGILEYNAKVENQNP